MAIAFTFIPFDSFESIALSNKASMKKMVTFYAYNSIVTSQIVVTNSDTWTVREDTHTHTHTNILSHIHSLTHSLTHLVIYTHTHTYILTSN